MVKFLFLAFAGCLVFGASCKKDNATSSGNTIVGIWYAYQYWISPGGGPVEWQPFEPPGQTIYFGSDGKFVGSSSFYTDVSSYQLVDSNTIKFQPINLPSGYSLMGYQLDTLNQELLLWPKDPFCIEGCEYKFRRSKS